MKNLLAKINVFDIFKFGIIFLVIASFEITPIFAQSCNNNGPLNATKDSCYSTCMCNRPSENGYCNSACGKLPVIEATLDGSPKTISPYFLGYYTGYYEAVSTSWNDPIFQKAVASMNPGTLRYPGGTPANYWNWETGMIIPNSELPANRFPDMYKNPNKLEDFKNTISKTGALPIFDLNLITSDLESQLRMLHHAQAIGLQIKYVELGNELNLPGKDYIAKFPTGADYGRVASSWAAAIKKDFPGVKIAVVGSLEYNNWPVKAVIDARRHDWNSSMYSTLTGVDAITFHPYSNLTVGKQTSMSDTTLQSMFGSPFDQMQSLQNEEFNKIPAGMKVWVTEYNLLERNAPVAGTWSQGMYNALQTLLFADNGRVELVNYEDILGDAGTAVLFRSNNAFYDQYNNFTVPSPLPATTKYGKSSNGWTLAMLGDASYGMTSIQKLKFNLSDKLVGGPNSLRNPGLVGYKFSDGKTSKVVILNLTSTFYTLKVDSLGLNTYEQILADPGAYISNDQMIRGRTAMTSGKFVLPGYSQNLLASDIKVLGDLNMDYHVNIFDYATLVGNYGKTGIGGFIGSDINLDGKVDMNDYNILVNHFGN